MCPVKWVQMSVTPLMKKSVKCGYLWESGLEEALTWSISARHKAEKIVLHTCK